MAIAAAIRSLLLANSTVASLVGTRIFPAMRAASDTIQPVYPCITYQRVSDIPVQVTTGRVKYSTARWQFDCLSSSYDSAETLAKAVEAALSGSTATSQSYKMWGTSNVTLRDGNELPIDGVSVGVARVIVDVEFAYQEP